MERFTARKCVKGSLIEIYISQIWAPRASSRGFLELEKAFSDARARLTTDSFPEASA